MSEPVSFIGSPMLDDAGKVVGVAAFQLDNKPIFQVFNDYSLPERLGHPQNDREVLRANSPINLVEKINRPLFMAYGGLDRNVLPEQGQQLARALDRANKKYEWMYKPDEAHGYFSVENRVEFYSKMEAFLRQHLGPIKQDRR